MFKCNKRLNGITQKHEQTTFLLYNKWHNKLKEFFILKGNKLFKQNLNIIVLFLLKFLNEKVFDLLFTTFQKNI